MCLFVATEYNQQRLRAWKPDFDAKTVVYTFLCIGVCFIPIGISLLMASNNVSSRLLLIVCWRHYHYATCRFGEVFCWLVTLQVHEVLLDYTYCTRIPQRDDLKTASKFLTCAGYIADPESPRPPRCVCKVSFRLPTGMDVSGAAEKNYGSKCGSYIKSSKLLYSVGWISCRSKWRWPIGLMWSLAPKGPSDSWNNTSFAETTEHKFSFVDIPFAKG